MENSVTSVEPEFFIVGSVRTGSTMLRLMLGHHPEICRCDEMEYFLPGIEMQEAGKSIEEFKEFLRYDRIFLLYDYKISYKDTFKEVADDIFAQLATRDPGPIMGGTIHNDFALLAKVWPNTRFIFLDRDPRDVARSVMNMGWAGTAWHAADFWSRAKQNWQTLSETIPAEQRLELRFEELVAEPESVLKQVCEFLNVEYTPEMLKIDENTTYKAPSQSEAASWEKKSKPQDIVEVESRIGKELIEQSGYKVSNYPVLETDELVLLKLSLRDKLGRMSFQWKRLGFSLWLLQIIANKTGNQALHRYVAPKINKIDNLHLK